MASSTSYTNTNISNNIRKPEWDVLLSAAQKNQPDRIRHMVLKEGVDPSHANVVGQSALHIACLWGHVEAVEALLEVGANYAAKNQLTGASPLHMVAQSNNKASIEKLTRVAQLLVEKGADRNQADNNGMIPIDFLQDDNTNSILHDVLRPRPPEAFAWIDGNQFDEMLAWLSSHHHDDDNDIGDTNNKNNNNAAVSITPAVADVKYGGQSLLPYAIDKFLLENNNNNQEQTNLSTEQLEQNIQVIKTIIDKGGLVNGDAVESNAVESPLYKTLLSLRDALKATDERKNSLSSTSSSSSDRLVQVVMLLIEGGAQVSDEIGQLLHQAARRNEMRFVQFLIEQMNIDPNLPGRQGMTPLQFAARSGQMQVLEYLLRLKTINVLAHDDRGQTALEAARVNEKHEAVAALEAALLLKRNMQSSN